MKIEQPAQFLEKSIGQEVHIRLKNGQEFTGNLISYDEYFNLRLLNAVSDKTTYGSIILRCNNVITVGVE